MKRKLFFLLVFIFGFCGVIGTFNLTFSYVQASSPSSSVWDGQLSSDGVFVNSDGSALSVNSSDWYNEGNNFYIYSAKGLAYFSNTVNNTAPNIYRNSNVYLETDIDWDGKEFKSIGTGNINSTFSGNFYGQGHCIYNLKIINNGNFAGFFGGLGESAFVNGLHLRNETINTSNMSSFLDVAYVGGVVGQSNGATLTNCSVKGNLTVSDISSSVRVGGIVGGGSVIISECFADTTTYVFASDCWFGGLIGQATSLKLSKSFHEGNIIAQVGDCTYIGGLVGNISGDSTIEDCYNSASIEESTLSGRDVSVGGLVGKVSSGKVSIANVYNSGNISHASVEGNYIGGLVGYSLSNDLKIEIAFSTGQIFFSGSGSLMGFINKLCNGSVSIFQVYFEDQQTNTTTGAVANLSILARTRGFYKNVEFFSYDWNFSSTWKISTSINNGFPYLDIATSNSSSGNTFDKTENIKLRGEGTANAPYLIETAGDLAYLSEISNSSTLADGNYFSLQNDINLVGRTWVPIGYSSLRGFNGVFDGNNHTISGLTCSLHEEVTFYGLFGKTGNSVIKNLIVEEVRYLTESNATGTLIGCVVGDTYLINCQDESGYYFDGTLAKTVGNVLGGNLFVGYGKNNVSPSGIIQTSRLSLSGIEFTSVYDVSISSEGGTFYDTTGGDKELAIEDIYLGEYHVLLSEAGEVISQNIDVTFGKTTLPRASSEIGSADVLFRRGYKLQKYVASGFSEKEFSWKAESVDMWINNHTQNIAVLGLEAVWEEVKVPIRIVYNQYELANFGAEYFNINYGNFETIDGTYEIKINEANGQIYIDFQVPYDTFLNEYAYFYTVPNNMRDGNFQIGALWTDFKDGSFAGENITETFGTLVNDTYLFEDEVWTLYAQWKGKDTLEQPSSITFRFTSEENIDLSQAINQIVMRGKSFDGDENEIASISSVEKSSDGSCSAVLTYNTLYSASVDDWLSFAVELNSGYTLSGDPTIARNGLGNGPNAGIDTNFGKLTTTDGQLIASADGRFHIKADESQQSKFCNLSGQFIVNVGVKKEIYIDKMNVQGEIVLGLSPYEKFSIEKSDDGYSSNVEIQIVRYGSVVYVDLLSILSLEEEFLEAVAEYKAPLYVAFDFKNDKVLFSSSQYDAIDVDFDSHLINGNFNLRYNGSKLVTFTKDYWDKDFGILMKENGINVIQLVQNEENEYTNMKYIAFDSFVFVASTESEGSSFSACDYVQSADGVLGETSLWTRSQPRGENDSSKYLHEFRNIVKRNRKDSTDRNNTFSVVSQYTQATIDFNFIYSDGVAVTADVPENFYTNLPKASFDGLDGNGNKNFDVSVGNGGEIVFYVQASDHFAFDGRINSNGNASVVFGDAENFNIKVQVSNANTSVEDFEENFNHNNINFFDRPGARPIITFFNRGSREGNGPQFENDTYKITLNYLQNTASNGLQAGKYTITLVCIDVKYSIDFATKFISANDVAQKNNSQLAGSILNGEISLSDEKGADILTYVKVDSQPAVDVACGDIQSVQDVLYSSSIEMFSSLQKNKSYSFVGWYFESEGKSSLLSEPSFEKAFEEFYIKNTQPPENLDNKPSNKKLVAYAIYAKKQVKLLLNGNVTLQDENGKEGNETYAASSRNIAFSMGGDYVYEYSLFIDPSNITLSMSGVNAAGYYLAGYEIYDGISQNAIYTFDDAEANSNLMRIDMTWIKEKLESGEFVKDVSQTFYLQPIIKQKQAIIYLHSGTGDESNQFGDVFNGEVFDENGLTVTSNVYAYGLGNEKIYFGNSLNLENGFLTSSTFESLQLKLFRMEDATLIEKTIDQIFASRKGYEKKSLYQWAWKSLSDGQVAGSGLLPLSSLALNADFFKLSGQTAEIHLYIVWEPNLYVVRYDSNDGLYYGSATGTTSDTVANYDDYVTFAKNNFVLTGYKFVEWNTQANGQGQSFGSGATVFRPNLKTGEVGQESVTLYAIWQERDFKVEIDFNSGAYQGKQVQTFTLKYNHEFKEMRSDDGEIVPLESLLAERTGFTLVGFYARNDINQSVRLRNDTLLNTSLLSAQFVEYDLDENMPIAITIYSSWEYVEEFVVLGLIDSSQTLTYNGREQTVYLNKYFLSDNINNEVSKNIFVTTTDDRVDFELFASDTSYETQLISASDKVSVSSNGFSFSGFDAGEFSLSFVITIIDDAEFFNKGTVQTLTVQLNFIMRRAEVSVLVDDDIKTLNAKLLMLPFEELDESAINTLADISNFIKESDSTASYATDAELYQYVIVKYYQLFLNDGALGHKTFKTWTYADFVAFKSSNEDLVQSIIDSMQFFSFFDGANHQDIAYYLPYLSFSSRDEQDREVYGISSDIIKQNVSVTANSALQARNSYELRVYLQDTANIENYIVSQDEIGSYLVLGEIYILPQAFVAKNESEIKSTYFSSNYSERQVEWIFNGATANINGLTYYNIGSIGENLLYGFAQLYTSNAGKVNEDVEYSYKNQDNFLYFSNVSVKLQVDGAWLDYSTNFKFVLDEEIFTILKVTDVIHVTVSAKYLTIVDGTQYCDIINSQNVNLLDVKQLPSNLISVDRVQYNLNGQKTVDCAGQTKYIDPETGILVYEILINEANVVELYVNKFVTNILFIASSRNVGDFIYLYKWQEGEYNQSGVDESVSVDDGFNFDVSKISLVDNGLTEVNYSAIYTDLVNLQFDYNFQAENAMVTQQFARLGHTTAEDFPFPTINGLACVKVQLANPAIDLMTEEGRSQFFIGENGTYVGINSQNPRMPLKFSVLWEVDPISGVPLMTDYMTAVSSFDRLYVSDVVAILNLNEKLYSYTYQWYRRDSEGNFEFENQYGTLEKYSLLSTEDVLILQEKGSLSESGMYKLLVYASLKEDFLGSLADDTVHTSSLAVDFNLYFMQNLLESISLPENLQAVYDNRDHINDWRVLVEYSSFNRDYGGYIKDLPFEQGYVEEGDIYFEIFLDGERVSEMKNAGTYTIFIRFQDGKFDATNFEGPLSFTYTILPCEVDLQDFDLDLEKRFNSEESTFSKQIVINGETVQINLHRNDKSEDVGEYGLFLDAEQNKNYVFKFEDKKLYEYENETLSELRENTAVGKFIIKSSGLLRLSFAGNLIRAEYAKGGFVLQLTDDFHLLIVRVSDGVVISNKLLTLYDALNGQEITNNEILNILSDKIFDLTAKFFSNIKADKAENAGTYNFAFEFSQEFSKYYSAVEISQEYIFEILPVSIDVSNLKVEKVFDGTIEVEVATGVEDVYIIATFASVHVGKNIPVDLRFKTPNPNYQLSSLSAYGQITPLSANLTFKMSAESYVYGDVSETNLSSLISVDKIMAGQDDVTSLLQVGYYNLSFALAGTVNTNARGLLYRGTYQVDTSACMFDDFDMEISELTFSIDSREFVAQIPENYITITTDDVVLDSYSKTQIISETGDEIALSLKVVYSDSDLTADGKLQAKKYALALKEAVDNTFGSILVSVPENLGFSVVSAAKTLNVSIADKSVLQQEYNGTAFELAIENKKLVITNGERVFESALKFTCEGEEVEDFNFAQVTIHNGANTNAGIYYLGFDLVVEDGAYTNVLFEEEYNFVITPRVIDPTNLVITKVFDMTTSVIISNFQNKLSSDEVSIVADYSDANVGSEKSVTLKYLQGRDKGNYQILSTAAVGTITPAFASISLTQDSFVYGEIAKQNSALARFVTISDEKGYIAQSQYSLDITIKNASYSQLEFLQVGEYEIEIKNTITNSNYLIENFSAKIQINPYTFEIIFQNDGEIKVEYSSELLGISVPYSIPSVSAPLREKIDFVLEKESALANIGTYKIMDGKYLSIDGNYEATVTDASPNGAFEITATKKRIYVLFKEADNVRNDLVPPQIEMTYDGNSYDSIRLEKVGDVWQLVIFNSINHSIRQSFALDFYTLENGEYELYDGVQVDELSSEISFRDNGARNVGKYEIRASGTTSSTTSDIWMGKEGTQFAFVLNVVPKDLYFNSNAIAEDGQRLIQNNTILQTFNGKYAKYSFQDKGLLLDGVVGGDIVTLNVSFQNEDGTLAKYAGTNYGVQASLEDAANYVLHCTTRPVDGSSVQIKGRILQANITLVVNTQTFTYGQFDGNIDFEYRTDIEGFDLESYFEEIKTLLEPRKFDYELTLKVTDGDYSSSGNLSVGDYQLNHNFSASDFVMGGFVIDGLSQTTLTARVIIKEKTLTLKEKEIPLKDIFTKRYDGTNLANIFEAGQLLFAIEGIVEGDDVEIVEATYESTSGQNLKVSFLLSSVDSGKADWKNYVVEDYSNGEITKVIIKLVFDYDKEKLTSNVTENNLEELSLLAYPFSSSGRLTSNSADTATSSDRNFPTSLRGLEGFNFAYWTMDFGSVTAQQNAFLTKLVALLGLTKVEKENNFSIKVGNDLSTVDLLKKLVEDETDVFGKYYFKNHEEISVVFTPNWTVTQHNFSIRLTNENGQLDSTLGQVVIVIDGKEEGAIIDSFRGLYDHGTQITLKAKAAEHCTFLGFFAGDTLLESGVDSEGNFVYVISALTDDVSLTLHFEKQRVNVMLDLSQYDAATFESPNFVSVGERLYRWTTNYAYLQTATLSELPHIANIGYDFVGFECDGQTFLLEDFDSTILALLLPNISTGTLSITFTPMFKPIEVEVTLDFGYENIVNTIFVGYNEKYSSASGWQETAARTGYSFVGWKNAENQTITGDSVMHQLQAHTLTAQWNVNTYSVELISPYAYISNANIVFTHSGDKYISTNVEYGSKVTFQVSAMQGYEIRTQDGWSEDFSVSVSQTGQIYVTLSVKDEDVSFTIPTVALENLITISGDHIEISAFDITNEKTEIEVNDLSLILHTGRKLRLEVTSTVGYAITERIVIQGGQNLQVEKQLLDGVLIVEIDGINQGFSIQFETSALINDIKFSFSDANAIEVVEVDGITYSNIEQLPTFNAITESNFVFFLKFKYGYEFDAISSAEFTVTKLEISEGGYEGYLKYSLSDISSDGTVMISSKLSKFNLTMEVISYDPSFDIVEVEQNKAFADGMTHAEFDFMYIARLTVTNSPLYYFAGWSKDGESIFSVSSTLDYTVEKDETIYAIFSAQRYQVGLSVLEYKEIYAEYSNPSKLEKRFEDINGGRFLNAFTGEEISNIEVYYGAEVTIKFEVPDGFMYCGFGYKLGNEFKYIQQGIQLEKQVEVKVSGFELDNLGTSNLFVVVTSYSIEFDVSTKINFDGTLLNDDKVGVVQLSNEVGGSVNAFGYVEGTRVHYGIRTDERNFSVVSYTNESVYIKVSMQREGYQLEGLRANSESLNISTVWTSEDFILYKIDGFVGGVQGIKLEIVFIPNLNVVDVSFSLGGVAINGGSLQVVQLDPQKRLWVSGNEYSSVSISAYTDTDFMVSAFIKAGFLPEQFDFVDEDEIIDMETLRHQLLFVEETGFVAKISFVVRNFINRNSIKISLTSKEYTVVLKDGDKVLAKVRNVKYTEHLDLSESNSQNIQIFDHEYSFENGRLNLISKIPQHNFEGYFTYENGVGRQYINSSGYVTQAWQENGYVFDTITNRYKLAENVFLAEDGTMEIPIYLYQSYLKTRIQFEFLPNISKLTALQMIAGANATNSWFYEANPNYIEITFNTDIFITAPEIEGYKFHKFVINQKTGNGVMLSQVTSYSPQVPWSTNEFDNIVEISVLVEYYAKVNIQTLGGESNVTLIQVGADEVFNGQGYVDTTLPVTVQAEPAEGYDFECWLNLENGQQTRRKTYTFSTSKPIDLQLWLTGKKVTLDFGRYDSALGQILRAESHTLNGPIESWILGSFHDEEFFKELTKVDCKVGDTITFVVRIKQGIAVTWNRQDIIFEDYQNGYYLFTLKIPSEIANQTIEIVPTFTNEMLSVFIHQKFDIEIENAIDGNFLEFAGSVLYKGQSTNFFTQASDQDLKIQVVTNPRYAISSIIIINDEKVFNDMNQFFAEGQILLSSDFLKLNEIRGTIGINITFERLMWEEISVEAHQLDGTGSQRNPYKIYTIEDLVLMQKLCNMGVFNPEGMAYSDCHFVLMTDLNLSERFWTPIGTQLYPFNGTFDFNGHKISGIFIARYYNEINHNGLFGVLGTKAQILSTPTSLWWIYLIVAIILLLIAILVILWLVYRNHKKQREEMAKK